MKKIFCLAFSAFVLLMNAAVAQNNDPVLMTIGKESVTKSEFIKAYQKNSSLSEATEADLREYLRLYADYRMKVQEAKALQLDTAKAFQKEWEAYKNQYAQQYLIDTEVSDQLLEETTERARYHVRASHILVRLSPNASPKDTLAAYHKIMKIREEIVNGLNFNEAAVLYSEDESARDFVNPQTKRRQPGNRGELGYFSALEMIYPFETAAFTTPVGQVSMPVRTQYGYHLVYVQDKIPAVAKIFVSQIFIKDSVAMKPDVNHDAVMAKYAQIKQKFQQGMSFKDLAAEYSEDNATKNNGGRMEPFTPNRRPGNFVYAAIKYMIKNRLSRDSRSKKSKESLVEKLKVEYNYNESGKKAAMKFFAKNMTDNYFQSRHIAPDSLKGIEKLKPMCTYADQKLTAVDFANYLKRYQGVQVSTSMDKFLENVYPNFVSDNMLRYESTRLMDKYPEYRDVVNEVYDGLLIYEVNSVKVWNAALADTVGTMQYYEQIKSQFATGDSLNPYKPFEEVRAVVISQYQDKMEKDWVAQLHEKYPVKINEEVFKTILKK